MNCETFRQKALATNNGKLSGKLSLVPLAAHLAKCKACQTWAQAEAKKPEYAEQRAKAQEAIDTCRASKQK